MTDGSKPRADLDGPVCAVNMIAGWVVDEHLKYIWHEMLFSWVYWEGGGTVCEHIR